MSESMIKSMIVSKHFWISESIQSQCKIHLQDSDVIFLLEEWIQSYKKG